MATRYKTYQTEYGFMTIDTRTETPPTDYIAVFDTTIAEADVIESGAIIQVDGDNLLITADEREAI